MKQLALAVLLTLAVPALSQTIDEQRHRVLREAYESFFNAAYRLIRPERSPHNADDWLMEQHFSPSNIERIENTVSQWYTDRQAVSDAWIMCAKTGAETKTGHCPFSQTFQQQMDKISFGVGAKLERQLDDGQRFHDMIEDCIHRLLLVPEYGDSCHFLPPKPRST
jgi:hypothetical protein